MIQHDITYVESLKEVINLFREFNLIIANPPYGSIGANITKVIIDNVDFDEYINLLPANDYKRNDEHNLFQYQTDMVTIKNGFSDAVVTTHLAKIVKEPNPNLTAEEFEIGQYTDKSLTKYFIENNSRNNYAIDAASYPYLNNPIVNNFSNETMLTVWQREVAGKHLGKRNSKSYKWNVEKSFDSTYFLATCFAKSTKQAIGAFCIFDTPQEKANIVKLLYSEDGFKFMSKIFTAINIDSGIVPLRKFLPKVDWTREWTVEQILAEYGYTADEIQEVMNDLVNFKGMED